MFFSVEIVLNFLLGKYIEKKLLQFTLSSKGWIFFSNNSLMGAPMYVFYCIVLRCMCDNFTYFAIKIIIRCHILEFGSDQNTCSLFSLRLMQGLRSITPFMTVIFIERQSALTSFYFHYSKNFIVPVVMSMLWILLTAVAQLVVMIIS